MGRPPKEARQQRRTQELLARAVARRDAEAGVAALLELPAGERAVHLDGLAPLFRDAVVRAHEERRWPLLAEWAARVAAEPQLLRHDAEPAAIKTVRWALLWGAARTGQWARARELWSTLRGELLAEAPALAQAVDTWLRTGGRPDPEALAGLPLGSDTTTRLGYDAGQGKRPPPAAPRDPEEAERALLAACARYPWREFVAAAAGWLKGAPPAVRAAIAIPAGELAVREALRQQQPGALPAFGCLELLAAAVAAGEAPPRLAEPALLALRLVLAARPSGNIRERPFGRALAAAGAAAACYPQHLPLVAAAVAELRFESEVAEIVLPLARDLAQRLPGPSVWVKALRLWANTRPEGRCLAPMPSWLTDGLRPLLDAPAPLAAWLAAQPLAHRRDTMHILGCALPVPLGTALVDGLWPHADDAGRRDLAALALQLIEHGSLKPMLSALPRGLQDPFGDMEGMLELLAAVRPELGDEAKALWALLGERLLPYHSDFLTLALQDANSDGDAARMVERYLAGRKDVDAWLEAIARVDIAGRTALSKRLLEQLCVRFAADPPALARALERALGMGAPAAVTRVLAQALMNAVEAGPGLPDERVAAAVHHAHRLLRPPAKRKSPAAGRKTRKRRDG